MIRSIKVRIVSPFAEIRDLSIDSQDYEDPDPMHLSKYFEKENPLSNGLEIYPSAHFYREMIRLDELKSLKKVRHKI